jgi:hypothetical protein
MARKSRASRRASRRSTRRTSRRGLFGTLYTPIGETIDAVDSLARIAACTASGLVHTALQGVNKAGKRVTSGANSVVRKTLFTRKQRKQRK